MQDKKRIWWDLFIMILATWNCFSIPFSVAFQNDYVDPLWLEIFNSSIDFIFILDLLTSFRTTYQHPKTGDEVMDLKMIAVRYFKGRFTIDLLASLPLDFFSMVSP